MNLFDRAGALKKIRSIFRGENLILYTFTTSLQLSIVKKESLSWSKLSFVNILIINM